MSKIRSLVGSFGSVSASAFLHNAQPALKPPPRRPALPPKQECDDQRKSQLCNHKMYAG